MLTTALALIVLALGISAVASAVVLGAGAYGARTSRPGTPHPDRQPDTQTIP